MVLNYKSYQQIVKSVRTSMGNVELETTVKISSESNKISSNGAAGQFEKKWFQEKCV